MVQTAYGPLVASLLRRRPGRAVPHRRSIDREPEGADRFRGRLEHVGIWIAVVVGAVVLAAVVALNLRMRAKGYDVPGRTAVRCSAGHVFRTSWIEGGSLKAVRLGPTTRYQRCPVGQHWAIVHPLREEELTPDERSRLGGDDG
jgi:hypothetical protein